MSVLADSCILIDCLSGHGPARDYLRALRRPAVSVITWMEVLVGTAPDDEPQVCAFLASFQLLHLDLRVSEEAVRLRRGRRLKLPDAIILATARVHGLDLATRNTRDFSANEVGILVPYHWPVA